MNYAALLQSKGFELNTHPEGNYWKLQVTKDEERKIEIYKAFQADIELFDASNIADIDTLILQCAEDVTKCLFFYDCYSWDMKTEEFMKCIEKIRGEDMTYQEELLYNSAMNRMNELADDVAQECCKVACDNHYERDWILERFRECFNKKVRELLN